ncbi:MAG: TatD family nuclease-associated radical SAM protein [Clostridia bacterium]
MNTITYEIDNNLYINLTNKCTNACVFCVRNSDTYEGYYLWLDREPTVAEVIASAGDVSKYNDIVFCGYGEPTFRVDAMVELGKYYRSLGKFVRVNTNGHGNKINNRNIAPELVGALDLVSISLNQSDKAKYQEICRSKYGEEAFDILIDFAKDCVKAGLSTQFSIVDVEGVDVAACQKLSDDLQIPLRVRDYIDVE